MIRFPNYFTSLSTGTAALAVCLLLTSLPSMAAPDDTERDLRGFDSTMVRREKAQRAMVKGKSYLDDGTLDMARKSLSEALALDENLHEARFYLGQTEYKDGKFKLAVALHENLYERIPKYRNLCLELARGYLALENCGTAGEWLERHLRNSKEDKETRKLKKQIEQCSKMREKKR